MIQKHHLHWIIMASLYVWVLLTAGLAMQIIVGLAIVLNIGLLVLVIR